MKYASEHVGVLTSVHQWKPIPPDRFASLLHYYSTAFCDRRGSEAFHNTALALDRDATATVFYRRKEREDSVFVPVLMTMEGPAGKTLCFESTNAENVREPETASSVVRAAMAFREQIKADRMKVVLDYVAKGTGEVLVIAPARDGLEEVLAACAKAGIGADRLELTLTTEVAAVKRSAFRGGVWLHNGKSVGDLRPVMDRIAYLMQGGGWMAMTGNAPEGWPAPDGLPKDRV